MFGHVGEGWAKSGPTWNVHDFAVTNIYPDGGIPMSPEPPWIIHNVYRARPTEDAKAIGDKKKCNLFPALSSLDSSWRLRGTQRAWHAVS